MCHRRTSCRTQSPLKRWTLLTGRQRSFVRSVWSRLPSCRSRPQCADTCTAPRASKWRSSCGNVVPSAKSRWGRSRCTEFISVLFRMLIAALSCVIVCYVFNKIFHL
uniref:(northern house mosquito) hypothetical protein n=1 Tax=Culex pipiens TaxID=7175 RepID=A0A8D8NBG4_CULPI